jgi:hypothetical protein
VIAYNKWRTESCFGWETSSRRCFILRMSMNFRLGVFEYLVFLLMPFGTGVPSSVGVVYVNLVCPGLYALLS